MLAHPGRRDAWKRPDPHSIAFDGVEVWNRKYDGWAPGPVGTELADRHSLVPFFGLDFHTQRQFFPLAMGIDAEAGATAEDLVAALRARRCRPIAFGGDGSRFLSGPGRGAARAAEGARRAARPAVRKVRQVRDSAAGGVKTTSPPPEESPRPRRSLIVQLFKVLQEIKRRRVWVVVVVLISALVGFLLAFKPGLPPHSRQYQQAIASADILVDTRNSQVVDVGGHGPELSTLASRANLLGNLMVTGPLKDTIAEAAGVSPEKLVVVPPGNAEEPGVAPAPVATGRGLEVPKSERSTLTFSTDDTLPILHVVAEAPDAETARELALATVVNLRKYLASVATTQRIPAARQLVVRQFGSPSVTTATRGVPHSLAIGLALILALVGVPRSSAAPGSPAVGRSSPRSRTKLTRTAPEATMERRPPGMAGRRTTPQARPLKKPAPPC